MRNRCNGNNITFRAAFARSGRQRRMWRPFCCERKRLVTKHCSCNAGWSKRIQAMERLTRLTDHLKPAHADGGFPWPNSFLEIASCTFAGDVISPKHADSEQDARRQHGTPCTETRCQPGTHSSEASLERAASCCQVVSVLIVRLRRGCSCGGLNGSPGEPFAPDGQALAGCGRRHGVSHKNKDDTISADALFSRRWTVTLT